MPDGHAAGSRWRSTDNPANNPQAASTVGHMVEDDDLLGQKRGSWILPVGEGVVTQLRIDFAFSLTIEQWIHIRIETPFVLERDGLAATYDPEQWSTLGPLLQLHQAVVREAEVRKDGWLRLRFADGATLTVEPDERFEAFSVSGALRPSPPKSFSLIALPGGGLARF